MANNLITIHFNNWDIIIDNIFLPAHICRIQAGTESQNYVYVCMYIWWVGSAFISSSSSSPFSLEEGSYQNFVGAVPRDLSIYDIISAIR